MSPRARAGMRALVLLAMLGWSLPSMADGQPDAPPEEAVETKRAGLQVVDFGPDGQKRVTVNRGHVTLADIAADHVNRVVTPFTQPQIWTSSTAEIQVSGGVLYIQPADEAPVSLFITETGREAFAVNLTLVPRQVPPVELFVDLDAALAGVLEAAYAQEAAMAAQGAPGTTAASTALPPAPSLSGAPREPWLETIKSVLTSMAVGHVPQTFSAAQPGTAPVCAPGHGFETAFQGGQWYRGARFEVIVGRVTNRGPTGVFQEFWCAGDDVAAVALWPSARLGPGGVAEVLILRHLGAPGGAAPVRTRPSLIGG